MTASPSFAASNPTELIEAIRAYKAALGLSDTMSDELCFLSPGATGKALGPARARGLGESTLAALMGGYGFDLVLVPNSKRFEAARARMAGIGVDVRQREASNVRTNHRVGKAALRRVMVELSKRATEAKRASGMLIEISRKAGQARQAAMTPAQRSRMARKLVRARRQKRRALAEAA